MSLPAVLTVAGSDPSGGAGIQVSTGGIRRVSHPIFPGGLLIPARAVGGFEDIHRIELLWDERHHNSHCTEHYRYPRRPRVSPKICQRSGEFSIPTAYLMIAYGRFD